MKNYVGSILEAIAASHRTRRKSLPHSANMNDFVSKKLDER